MSDAWKSTSFDTDSRLFGLVSEDGAVTLSFTGCIEADGRRLSGTDADADAGGDGVSLSAGEAGHVELAFGAGLVMAYDLALSADGETLVVDCELRNGSDAAVTLGKCCPVCARPGLGHIAIEGDDGEAVVLQSSAQSAASHVYRAADADKNARYNVLFHIVSHAAGRALHLGFVTFDRIPTCFVFDYDRADGLTHLEAACDFDGWKLGAGASVRLETLTIEALADSHASLHRWTDRVAAYYQPEVWPKIPGSWLGWAWVDAFNVENYEQTVLRNCDAIRRRLPGCDIEYVWVSIGNIAGGHPGNWLEWNADSFPGGHKYLVEELAKRDFKLGLWCGAFWYSDHLESFGQMRDALLKVDGEPAVSRPGWSYGEAGLLPPEQRPNVYSLDPTHPTARKFLREVFTTYREWGVRYYMLDFLYAVWGCMEFNDYHDMSVIKGPQLLRKGLEVITEASGPETYRLSSTGPTIHCINHMAACRIGNDYGEGRALTPQSHFYPATFVINSAEFWTSHKPASTNMACSYFTHNKLFINDSGNVMTVDKPIPMSEAQITATIFGLSGGPVMLGDDIDRISEERLALIKKVFPRTSEIATPVDLFDSPYPGYPRVFHLPVETDWGSWDVVGILNYDAEPYSRVIPLADFGLEPESEYIVWEFWNEQYVGVASGALKAVVPPRSARLYRVCRLVDHPQVLGTDMHVLQGQVELSRVHWDAKTMTLSGSASRPAGEVGSLFVRAPKGLFVRNPKGHWIAKDAVEECLVIRRQFCFGERAEDWAMEFGVLE